jgi:hypothetical protein
VAASSSESVGNPNVPDETPRPPDAVQLLRDAGFVKGPDGVWDLPEEAEEETSAMRATVDLDRPMPTHTILVKVSDGVAQLSVSPNVEPEVLLALHPDLAEIIEEVIDESRLRRTP